MPGTCDISMGTLVVVPFFFTAMVKLSDADTPGIASLIWALVTNGLVA